MKALLTFLPAVVLAAFLTVIYGVRTAQENRLRERLAPPGKPVDTGRFQSKTAAVVPISDKPLPAADREIVPLSREQGLRLLEDLMATAVPPGTSIKDSQDVSAVLEKLKKEIEKFTPEQLAALVATNIAKIQRVHTEERDFNRENIENLLMMEARQLLAKHPPTVVLRALEGLDPLNIFPSHDLIPVMLKKLAETDPDEALAWVRHQPGGSGSREAHNAIVETAAGGDAFSWLRLLDQYDAGKALVMIGSRTAMEHPAFREAWVEKVIAFRGEEAALDLQKFAAETHDIQGFAAARDFVGQHPELPKRDEAIRAVATNHLIRNGAEKADWMVAETSPANLRANTEALMKAWTAKDPAGAADWLNATPAAAPWRDVALKTFAEAVAPHDAEAALTFAERIGDAALREQTSAAVIK